MPAETATDVADLFAGSDDAAGVTLADGCVIQGIFRYSYAESLDYNGRMPSVLAASADVSGVSVGQSIKIDEVEFTVAAREQGDRTTTLFLEKP